MSTYKHYLVMWFYRCFRRQKLNKFIHTPKFLNLDEENLGVFRSSRLLREERQTSASCSRVCSDVPFTQPEAQGLGVVELLPFPDWSLGYG